MTIVTFQRPILLGLTLSVICLAGCCSTRMCSTPKWNLAWWKKDKADPETRHDEIEPPTARIQPLVAELAKEKQEQARTRSPYPIDGVDIDGGSTPMTPPVNGLAAQQSTTAAASASMSPDAMSGAAPVGYSEPSSNTLNQATQVGHMVDTGPTPSNGFAAQPAGRYPAQGTTPMRVVNPFANDAGATSKPQAVPLPSSTASASAAADYSQTPYQSFAPRSSDYISKVSTVTPVTGSAPSPSGLAAGTTPLQPLQPRSESVTSSPPPPLKIPQNSSAATTASTNAGADATNESNASSPAIPESLLQAQGSFAPGSIRTARADSGSESMSPSSFPVSPSMPANPISPPPTTATPSSSLNLGGGGSFQFK